MGAAEAVLVLDRVGGRHEARRQQLARADRVVLDRREEEVLVETSYATWPPPSFASIIARTLTWSSQRWPAMQTRSWQSL